jgi:hypothetical protein|tara:strand:+ start:823 stop:1272 length:450 start_codon:yes stop_codon:yes gene_type:complete
MWFNILKEDGDKLWNQRTVSFFIQRLEKIFDSVETNAAKSVLAFRKEYEDEEGDVWKINSYIELTANEEKRGELNIKYYVDGKHWDRTRLPFFTYNNLSELLDDLELLDKRLTDFFSNMVVDEDEHRFSVVRNMVKDIMGVVGGVYDVV